ncbi:MAG: NAD(+) synthase [Deltaproteobacteria bacterium]|nr:NAD(+) synthase [Deltaproteobacteria bacterium]
MKVPATICPADNNFRAWLDLLNLKPSHALLEAMASFLRAYLESQKRNRYILGVSGGIDSGFLAALLHRHDIPFTAFSIPIATNRPDERTRAEAICRAYAPASSWTSAQDLTDLYYLISTRLWTIFNRSTPAAEGNIKARIRMTFLYHAAQLLEGCVLSTDQLDELLTGFWTLHGDVGDVSPLQLIPKSVEYELAEILCLKLDNPAPLRAAIKAVPTDGLGISTSDLDQMGAPSFTALEDLFHSYFTLRLKAEETPLTNNERSHLDALEEEIPIKRFKATGFKRSGAIIFDPLTALP